MTTLPLNQINTTPAELARVRLCQDTLTRYVELIKAGERLPPVTVFYDGKTYWLGDGRHRLEARKKVGYSDISAKVRNGSERDAQLYAFSANHTHGLPASPADRRKIARILLDDEQWKTWSDRKIAELSGLSHPTVGKMREALVKFTTPAAPAQKISVAPRMTTVSASSIEGDSMKEPDEQTETYDPFAAQLSEMAELVAHLTTDNERLREQIALGTLSIPEDERININGQLEDLHKKVNLAEIEVTAIKGSRDSYLNENRDLIKEVKKLRYVLKKKDDEIAQLQKNLISASERIESLEGELDFERATR